MVNAYGNFVCTIQCSLFSIRMSFSGVFFLFLFLIFNCCFAEVVANRTVRVNTVITTMCLWFSNAGKSLGVMYIYASGNGHRMREKGVK